MGEYAKYNGQEIKIGTCEDMYYLRADQVNKVEAIPHSLDPRDPRIQQTIRFRFPWPDEDHLEPGPHENVPYHRSVAVDIDMPAELEHFNVQFSAPSGYLVSLPCPENALTPTHGLTIARNGFQGRVHLQQQAWRGGLLVACCRCGGCGTVFRLPTLKDAEPLIVALRSKGDIAHPTDAAGNPQWYHAVADRVAAGYAQSGAVPGDASGGDRNLATAKP